MRVALTRFCMTAKGTSPSRAAKTKLCVIVLYPQDHLESLNQWDYSQTISHLIAVLLSKFSLVHVGARQDCEHIEDHENDSGAIS